MDEYQIIDDYFMGHTNRCPKNTV